MPVLFEKGYHGLTLDDGYFTRAFYREAFRIWEDHLANNILWNGDKAYQEQED